MVVDPVGPAELPAPKLELDVVPLVGGGLLTAARPVDYLWRVDGGPWRLPRTADDQGRLVLDPPQLVLQGRHTVELKARWAGDWSGPQPDGTRLEVVVDYEAPMLEVEQSSNLLHLRGDDAADGPGHLEYRWRLEGQGLGAGVVRLEPRPHARPREHRLRAASPDRGRGS